MKATANFPVVFFIMLYWWYLVLILSIKLKLEVKVISLRIESIEKQFPVVELTMLFNLLLPFEFVDRVLLVSTNIKIKDIMSLGNRWTYLIIVKLYVWNIIPLIFS